MAKLELSLKHDVSLQAVGGVALRVIVCVCVVGDGAGLSVPSAGSLHTAPELGRRRAQMFHMRN